MRNQLVRAGIMLAVFYAVAIPFAVSQDDAGTQSSTPLKVKEDGAAPISDAPVSRVDSASSLPTNAQCADAEAINGEGVFTFDNSGPLALDLPRDGCPGDYSDQFLNDVWFCWTASRDGDVTVDMRSLTTFDTIVAVHQGCDCPTSSSSVLVCQDDTDYSYQPQVTFSALASQSYLIRIGSSTLGSASSGTGEFRVSYDGERDPLCSTDIARCQPPGTKDAVMSIRGEYVVADDFTPDVDSDISEVCWWGTYFEDSWQCGRSSSDDFEVRYYADDLGLPGILIGGPFSQSSGSLVVTGPARTDSLIDGGYASYQYKGVHTPVSVLEGSCYWIEVTNSRIDSCTWMWQASQAHNGRAVQDGGDGAPPDGFDLGDVGATEVSFCLNASISSSVSCMALPVNDDCANAQTVSDGVTRFDTAMASTDGPVDRYNCRPPNLCYHFPLGDHQVHNDIWFDYTATCDGTLIVDLCGSSFDTKVAVYDGVDCPPTSLLASNDDACGSDLAVQSQASLLVTQGHLYKIQVGGSRTSPPVEVSQCRSWPVIRPEPGCGDLRCEAIVCAQSPTCCDANWGHYPSCIFTAEYYCPGSCHLANPSAGCIDPLCEARVCAIDPTCCTQDPDLPGEWRFACANLALDLCTAAAGTGVARIRCVESLPADRCEDAPLERPPFTVVGSNASATHECDKLPGNHTWVPFELCDATSVTIDYGGSDPVFANAWTQLALGCPCDSLTDRGMLTRSADGNPTITWNCLSPGTYYYPVLSEPGSQGQYQLVVELSACTGSHVGGPGNCCDVSQEPGCSDAACSDTVCAVDSFCCDVQWDALCAREAATICTACSWDPCAFAAGDCLEAKDTPGCGDRVTCEMICQCDPYCCDVEWDEFCAGGGIRPGCGASADCNANDTIDIVDIATGTSDDCNDDGVPDDCEPDCNTNLIADECDISGCVSTDCNQNEIPDECDLVDQTSFDCNGNGTPDECDIANGFSVDCNHNGVPDDCDLLAPSGTDCNNNSIPDECDLSSGSSEDCDGNQVPDECQPDQSEDCNNNGVWDPCDIADGTSGDINHNTIPDDCESNRTFYVDDDATNDPGPGDPSVSDLDEDGSTDHPFDAIQEAIDAALHGDVVIVSNGTYTGIGNRDLDFLGKIITVEGASGPELTIIDCEDQTGGLQFRNGETTDAVFRGFTITRGNRVNGGAIYIGSGSPTIYDCILRDNRARTGGAIHANNGTPVIVNTVIVDNVASDSGGGIQATAVNMQNCIVARNETTITASFATAGIVLFRGQSLIVGTTITGNISRFAPGGLYCDDGTCMVRNSIIYGNTPTDAQPDAMHIAYSVIGGDYPGRGNLDLDPMFLDAAGGDYRLSSASPCIDRGQPKFAPYPGEVDAAGDTRVQNCRVDMGAFESAFWQDCDGNGQSDACEIVNETAPDCNRNFQPDACDLAGIAAEDCQGNGQLDACEGQIRPWTFSVLEDLNTVSRGDYHFSHIPPAVSDVRVIIEARENIDGVGAFIDMWLNDSYLGQLFSNTGTQCPDQFDRIELLFTADQFNNIVSGEDAWISWSSSWILGNYVGCGGGTFLRISVSYDAFGPPDCNANGVSDLCDLFLNTSSDCNLNQIPDECDGQPGVLDFVSEHLGPIGGNTHTLNLPFLPVATGDVVFSLSGFGDLSDSSENVDVFLNGSRVGRAFITNGEDCEDPPSMDTIVMSAGAFNAIAGAKAATLRLKVSSSVTRSACNNQSYVTINLSYDATIPPDCNGNSVLDECDIADATSIDCNSNGVPDECDIADGAADDCNSDGVIDPCEDRMIGDFDADGDADLRDLAAVQGCFTGSRTGTLKPCCSIVDFAFDGTVDLDDYALTTGSLTGPGL